MTTKYLLSCQCGEELQVEARESGLTRRCSHCDAEVEVPALRHLTHLPRVEEEPDATAKWGPLQALVVVGAALALVGLGVSLYLLVLTPGRDLDYVPPLPDEPAQVALEYRRLYARYLEKGLVRMEKAAVVEYQRMLRVRRFWGYAALAVGVIGLLIIPTGILIARAAPPGRPTQP